MIRKFTLLFSAMALAGFAHSQITLTSATHAPTPGDGYDYITVPNPAGNFSNGGANQTWDFSSFSGTATAFDYISLASSGDASSFPNANVVESSGGSENYYSSTTSGLTFEGHYIPSVTRIIYSDKREFINFPITYNDVFNETFAGVLENLQVSQSFSRSGTIEITADAHGTLVLPYATVDDVLRVRQVVNYVDTAFGVQVASYTDTIFTWYDDNNKNFIANWSVNFSNGFQTVKQAVYIDQADFIATGIGQIAGKENTPKLFPNPAQNQFSVANAEAGTVTIFDLTGKMVRNVDLSANPGQPINVADLDRGIYLVKVNTEKGTHTERLVVN